MMLVDSSTVMKEPEKFEPVGKFETNYIFNKIFTFVEDVVFTDERQFSIVNLIQNVELDISMSIQLLKHIQDLVTMIIN